MKIEIKLLDPRAKVPTYGTAGAAGMDVYALLPEFQRCNTIEPGEQIKVHTGVAVSINDPSWALVMMPRSGLASKGIVLANSVGLIDSDYQGELIVLLMNRGKEAFVLQNHDRIAQGVLMRVAQANFTVVEEFGETSARGTGGFGSTGVSGWQDKVVTIYPHPNRQP